MMNRIIDKLLNEKDELVLNYPYITISNNKIQIENYKKVYKYSSSEIIVTFNTFSNKIIISGSNLNILFISKYLLVIKGQIASIEYPNRKERV